MYNLCMGQVIISCASVWIFSSLSPHLAGFNGCSRWLCPRSHSVGAAGGLDELGHGKAHSAAVPLLVLFRLCP